MGCKLRRIFNRPEEFWEYVSQDPTKVSGYEGTPESASNGHSFTGTNTYGEAQYLARYGWPEGARKARTISDTIKARIGRYISSHEPVYDVVGECPDVGAFLSGEPEHMVGFHLAEKEARILRIVVNVSASCGVSKEAIMGRGAAVCAMVDAIEQSGTRTEVCAAFSNQGEPGFTMAGYVVVKNADEPLNMDRVAFCLAHPSFMRRLEFRALELEKPEHRIGLGVQRGHGYGKPAPIPADMAGDITMDQMTYGDDRWRDPERAASSALDIMRKAGIEIKEEV